MGRIAGRLNVATKEGRAFARQFLESEEYRESIERRIDLDELPAGVEVALWHYAFGKPTDKVEVALAGTEALEAMSDDDLAEQARSLSVEILKLKADREVTESPDLDPELGVH